MRHSTPNNISRDVWETLMSDGPFLLESPEVALNKQANEFFDNPGFRKVNELLGMFLVV